MLCTLRACDPTSHSESNRIGTVLLAGLSSWSQSLPLPRSPSLLLFLSLHLSLPLPLPFAAVTNGAHLHRDLALEETGQDVARVSYPQLQRVDTAPLIQGRFAERSLQRLRSMFHNCRHSHSVADLVSTGHFVRSNLDLSLDQRCQEVLASTSICQPLFSPARHVTYHGSKLRSRRPSIFRVQESPHFCSSSYGCQVNNAASFFFP